MSMSVVVFFRGCGLCGGGGGDDEKGVGRSPSLTTPEFREGAGDGRIRGDSRSMNSVLYLSISPTLSSPLEALAAQSRPGRS